MKILIALMLVLPIIQACNPKVHNMNPVNAYSKVETKNINEDYIAKDAVNQLRKIFPPAKTHLNFICAPKDQLGTFLIEELRLKGYAVTESKTKVFFGNSKVAEIKNNKIEDEPTKVNYIYDELHDEGCIRLTLIIGNKMLSRVYYVDVNGIGPSGQWTYKG